MGIHRKREINIAFIENFSMAMVNQERYLPVKTNSISPSTADEHLDKPRVPNVKPQFEIGDIVWAQARGLPSWPGKVVDASEVGKGRPDDGKVLNNTFYLVVQATVGRFGKRQCNVRGNGKARRTQFATLPSVSSVLDLR